MGLGKILEAFIIILVGMNLAPVVANSVQYATTVNSSGQINATLGNTAVMPSAAATMLTLTGLFFSIGVMTAGIGIGVSGLQEIGLM